MGSLVLIVTWTAVAMMVAPGFGSVSGSQLCEWASRTVVVRQELHHTFGQLKTTMNESMGISERSVSAYMHFSTSFSPEQPMSSLASTVTWVQQGLTCMGRAMDLRCPFRPHRRCTPSHSPLPKLYWAHVLPHNVRLLRSSRLFRQMYHDAAFLLQQLRASLVGSESEVSQEEDEEEEEEEEAGRGGGGEVDCSGWSNNEAMVLVLSFLHVREGQTFLENVSSSACV